jgi:hypothetical protein
MPTWNGDVLLTVENNRSPRPLLLMFNDQGQRALETSITIPGSDWVDVYGVAHGVGGVTAICGLAKDAGAHVAAFLALASPSGSIRKIVRTEPYVATAVAVAPDNTIWTKGTEYDSATRKPAKTDNGILRHFDVSGAILAKVLPQSALTARELYFGIDQLACNSTRVGWYMGRGAKDYFEVVNDRLERFPVIKTENADSPEFVSGLTITDEDAVFVTKDFSGHDPELYGLDRVSRSWSRVAVLPSGAPATTNWLVGGSRNTLVFRTTAGFGCLRRFEVRTR